MHTRSQFSYYPQPNFAAYGMLDSKKLMDTPVKWFEGIGAFKTDSMIGVAGLVVALAAGAIASDKKVVIKKPKVTQKNVVQLAGIGLTIYSMVQTYRSL